MGQMTRGTMIVEPDVTFPDDIYLYKHIPGDIIAVTFTQGMGGLGDDGRCRSVFVCFFLSFQPCVSSALLLTMPFCRFHSLL